MKTTQVSRKNSKPFGSFQSEKRTEIDSSSKDKVLWDIDYKMSMVLDTRKSSFGSQLLWFHIWFIMTLYYKIRQTLLQNTKAILLQNATNIY